MTGCSVFGCKKRSDTSSLQKDNVTFHMFPKDRIRRHKWIKACQNHRTWLPKRTSKLCSDHFEPSCFLLLSRNKRKLNEAAIPTLKLPDFNFHESSDCHTLSSLPKKMKKETGTITDSPCRTSTSQAQSIPMSSTDRVSLSSINKDTPRKLSSLSRKRKQEQADASHASSSQRSDPSNSQHFTAATSRTSSLATDDDDDPGDAELFAGHSDDGSMDTIDTSTKTETSTKTKMTTKTTTTKSKPTTETETSTKTKMTTKSKTTKSKPTTETKTTVALRTAADISGDENYRCNVCSGSIVGFRYTCVQCAHYDLCTTCESRGEHSLHYVLRIPKLAKDAEVAAMLSKIRTYILYGLETEEAEQDTDDRVVPALPAEFEIKAEIKEELPDPLEHEDAFQPDDDDYTEPEYIARESTPKEKTLTPAPVNTSSMILTETEGNYVIIENPVKVTKTEPKTTKHKTTEPEHDGSEKRMKMYLEEQTRATEALMDTSDDTAGPPTEGASGELPVTVKTEEKDEGIFQVFSHSSHKILKDKPGLDTGMTKSKAKSTSKKKVV